MISPYLIQLLNKKGFLINKNYFVFKLILKNFYKLFNFLYSFFLTPVSINLVLFLKLKNKYYKNKYFSLRISERYFGHHAIEPAIASSIQSSNENKVVFVSIKEKNNLGNKKLKNIIKHSFILMEDYKLKVLENIYYKSFKFFRVKIKNFYQPLFPNLSKYREIKYWPYLDSSKNFKWRDNALGMLGKNTFSKSNKNIVIALRTHHFHKNTKLVKPQNYRNAEYDDLVFILEACIREFTDVEIICFFSSEICHNLSKRFIGTSNLRFVSQENVDILDILTPQSLLINNGNGIGAAAFAIGIKTLLLLHSPWTAWFTSNANAIMLPIEYLDLKKTDDRSLDQIFNLAFYPKEHVPWDYEKEYFANNIILQKIKDIDIQILKSTIREAYEMEINSKFKKNIEFLNTSINYCSNKEKIFWKMYVERMPKEMRCCHKKISMSISSSFLESFKK